LEPLTRYVDPFIGTGGHGHVYPGATVPWGMVQLSPDQGQQGWDWIAGYNWEDSLLVGFSHTHLSGTGIGDLLDILVMPVSHYVPLDVPIRNRWDRAARSRFSHDREEASPGYYAVDLLDQEIRAELTATARVGVHRYTFPETDQPALFLDLGYAINWDAPVQTSVRVVSDTLVTGYRFSRGWARDQRVFFAMAFSRPVRHLGLADSATALGIFSGQELTAGDAGATAQAVRALFAFDPVAAAETLLLKVGISYVDEEGALANLEEEVPHWDFDRVREEARRAWERELRKVHVQGGTETERRTFYTALYRTRLAPILFQDADGRYRGADGQIHTAQGYRKHAIFSLWDTFRAQHPLLTLIDPDRVDDLVNSMLSFHDEYGFLPVWSLVGNETNTMTGHHALPVITDAYRKGFRGFDGEKALEAMVKSATADHRGLEHYKAFGYIPTELEVESVTKTLEYAFDDWALAAMALELGEEDSPTLPGAVRGLAAHLRPRDPLHAGEDRRWPMGRALRPPSLGPQGGHRLHRGERLAALLVRAPRRPGPHGGHGGEERFLAKLDSLFELDTIITGENVSADITGLIGQYAHGNEPSHHIAYLYNYAGRPWKTADRVREILATQYDDTPFGLSGNEDCGQMSAWYVLSALGIYPVNPAEGTWVLGSPLFPEATLDLGGRAAIHHSGPGRFRGEPLRAVRQAERPAPGAELPPAQPRSPPVESWISAWARSPRTGGRHPTPGLPARRTDPWPIPPWTRPGHLPGPIPPWTRPGAALRPTLPFHRPTTSPPTPRWPPP
jgi:putative alpha-1,2-mannosidase